LFLTGRRREAFIRDAEREWRDREYDLRVALEEGREDLVEEIVTDLLRSKARVLVRLSRKAAEHPDVRRLLPPEELYPPRRPPAPEVGVGVPGLPREAVKWTRWLAKVERMLFAPAGPTIPMARPSLRHPNPFISSFPPMGERINEEVELHPATVAGLAKIAEMAGRTIPRKTRWSIPQLRRLLEEIYDVVTPGAKEWIRALREVLGI